MKLTVIAVLDVPEGVASLTEDELLDRLLYSDRPFDSSVFLSVSRGVHECAVHAGAETEQDDWACPMCGHAHLVKEKANHGS